MRAVNDSCAFWGWTEPRSAQVAVAEQRRDADGLVQHEQLLHDLELFVFGVSCDVQV